ncbi:hypothetical protein ALP65_04641 [Pseudomonas aeruginosa]|uniref:Uncharacterized protein n=1 Tax=Pseudomonas aeruginosa TaxID=287 RepID=A0A3M5EMI9_PSEAI|nr:hypothetical protein ALP65_04641 [Pseudomonas aeruginosa]
MQTVLEQRAVGQVGEGVVVGQAVDAPLAGLALADVAEEADEADQVAFLVAHRGDADPGWIELAGLALLQDLAFPTAAVLQAGEHVLELVGFLAVGGEQARLLVEHVGRAVAGQAREGIVDLDDVAGRVGDHDRRRGVFEYRRRHPQLAFGAALLADVAGDAEQAFEAVVLVPHQDDPQFDGNLASVGAQAVEGEQMLARVFPQLGELLAVADGVPHAAQQAVQAAELARVGGGLMEAVEQRPFRAVAEHVLYRGADVAGVEFGVGGEDHVADVFRQHAVASAVLAQRVVRLDGEGDVLGHADQARHATAAVAAEGLLADVEPVPAAVAVAPAQLAVEQQAVADHVLQVADAPVVFLVVGVQQGFPEVLAHPRQFFLVVAQLLAQVMVAEDHPARVQVVDVEGIGHRLDRVRPELLALDQRQFDFLATGDVGQAEGHRMPFAGVFRQAQLQPQVPRRALAAAQRGFKFEYRPALDERLDHLQAQAVRL